LILNSWTSSVAGAGPLYVETVALPVPGISATSAPLPPLHAPRNVAAATVIPSARRRCAAGDENAGRMLAARAIHAHAFVACGEIEYCIVITP
jgi:hypothetical protein